jgi:hypothetical protein
VTSILEKSEAYRRGLRADDEIVSFAGRPIRSVNQFKNVLGIYPKGWKLPLVFRHEGRKQEVYVRLRGLHRQSELTPDKPKEGTERPQPDERRRRGRGEKPGSPPAPRPGAGEHPAPAKPPEHLAKLFVERSGFANYHFNEIERDRLLKGIFAIGDFSRETGTWKLSGTLAADESPFEFTLADKLAGLTLDGGKKVFAQEVGVTELEDEPPGTGGLLLAMHQLRLLLVRSHQGFSELYYQGSEPMDGSGPLVDVLTSERYGARTQWYIDRETGLLLGLDTYRDEDVDPCEVRLEGWTELSGRRLPSTLMVRHAEKEYGRFKLTGLKFGPPSTEPAAEQGKAAPPAGGKEPASSKSDGAS